jgi:hypothetical protein
MVWNISSSFATNCIHWTLPMLLASLMDTLGALCNDPNAVTDADAVTDPYDELQNDLLQFY